MLSNSSATVQPKVGVAPSNGKAPCSEHRLFLPASHYSPVPEREHVVLEKVLHFRHELSEFRKHAKHVATFEDINRLSMELGKIMDNLRQIRAEASVPTDRNKIDDMLDYVWAVLFKEWVHIAGVGEPLYPFYAKLATLMRQLELLKDSQAYSLQDLRPLQERLHVLEQQMRDNGIVLAALSGNQLSLGTELAHGSSESLGFKVPSGEHMIDSLLKRIHRNIKYMVNFASSVPSELVDTHQELLDIHSNLKIMVETDEFTQEDLEFFVSKLGDIDRLRVHSGRFLPIPMAQASTLALLFACYEHVTVLHMRRIQIEPSMSSLLQQIVDLELNLTSIFNFERFNVSIINLREYEDKLRNIRNVDLAQESFKMSLGATKLILYYHLARCHHLIRMLLIGVEDVSENLVSLFETLVGLHFQARDEFYKAIRHESGHHALHRLRSFLEKLIAEKQDAKTGYFCGGDASNVLEQLEMHGGVAPVGQTIIKSLVEELSAQTDLMEAWLTLF